MSSGRPVRKLVDIADVDEGTADGEHDGIRLPEIPDGRYDGRRLSLDLARVDACHDQPGESGQAVLVGRQRGLHLLRRLVVDVVDLAELNLQPGHPARRERAPERSGTASSARPKARSSRWRSWRAGRRSPRERATHHRCSRRRMLPCALRGGISDMPVRHVLERGECLQSLALQHGFKDGQTIYDGPDNADLRHKRAAPAEIVPGDVVVIPDRTPRELPLTKGKPNRFKVQVPAGMLRVYVCDEAGQALAGKSYELKIKDDTVEGKTTSDGAVEEPVRLNAIAGMLVVYESNAKDGARWIWSLRIANLEAPETRAGAWQRLANLGYWSPEEPAEESTSPANNPADNPLDPLVLAIRAFQHDEQLDESGRIDDPTRKRLVERHGV